LAGHTSQTTTPLVAGGRSIRALAAGLWVAVVLALALATPGAAATAGAAPGDVVWRDFSQRAQNGEDAYRALAVTGAGRVCAAGVTTAAAGAPGDVLLRKYAPSGAVAWRRVWTWPGRSDDGAAAIARDRRGSFLVAGSSGSSWLLLKYSAGGYLQWVRRGRAPYARCSLAAVAVDRAGNVYVAGSATAAGASRVLVLKLSSGGALRWRRTLGSGAGDAAATGIALGGGDVYVAGRSATGTSTSSAVTAKYSAGGARRWVRSYAGGEGEAVRAAGISYAAGPVVTGHGSAGAGPPQGFVVRYAPDGTQIWAAGYDGAGVTGDQFNAVVTAGGGACVTGSRWAGGAEQMFTVAFDAQGALAWEAVTPGAARGTALCRTAAGFCAAGGTEAAVSVLLSSTGSPVWSTSLSPPSHGGFLPAAVGAAGAVYLYAAGSAALGGGGTAAMLVRYRP